MGEIQVIVPAIMGEINHNSTRDAETVTVTGVQSKNRKCRNQSVCDGAARKCLTQEMGCN